MTPGRLRVDKTSPPLSINPAGRFKQLERLLHGTDIVHANKLHALPRQRQGHAEGARQSVGLPVPQHFTDESFAGMPD